MPLKLTPEQIEAGKSPAGGFTRKQLAKWGVNWPPPHGWRKALLAGEPIPQPNHTQKTRTPLERSKPVRHNGDAQVLLRQLVVAVINAGRSDILYNLPDVVAYFSGVEPEQKQDIREALIEQA